MDEDEKHVGPSDMCDVLHDTEQARYLKDKLVEVAGLSELFKVLSDETRTEIIYLLAHKELCVCEIAYVLDMSMPAVAHHLRLLRAFKLVKYRRSGRMAYYSLDDDHILNLIRQAQEHFAKGR